GARDQFLFRDDATCGRSIAAWGAEVRIGSNSDLTGLKREFRYTPRSRHLLPERPSPFRADSVARVALPKVSKILAARGLSCRDHRFTLNSSATSVARRKAIRIVNRSPFEF